MSANDIRALENQNPIPAEDGGDALLVNGNMIPITTAMQARAEDVTGSTNTTRTDNRKGG